MLGLQDRTVLEVSQAGARAAAAADRRVQPVRRARRARADRAVRRPGRRPRRRAERAAARAGSTPLLLTRAVDVAIGPAAGELDADDGRARRSSTTELILVAGPDAPAGRAPRRRRRSCATRPGCSARRRRRPTGWCRRDAAPARGAGGPPADLPEPRGGAGGGQAQHRGVALAVVVRRRPRTCGKRPPRQAGRRPAAADARARWNALTLADQSATAGRRRAGPVRHHAAGDPGDAARVGRQPSATSSRPSTSPCGAEPPGTSAGPGDARAGTCAAAGSSSSQYGSAAAIVATSGSEPGRGRPAGSSRSPGARAAAAGPSPRASASGGSLSQPSERDDHDRRRAPRCRAGRPAAPCTLRRDPGAAEPVGHQRRSPARPRPRPSGARAPG